MRFLKYLLMGLILLLVFSGCTTVNRVGFSSFSQNHRNSYSGYHNVFDNSKKHILNNTPNKNIEFWY